jgi:phosphoribosyl-dephospho-CoA transferase
MTPEFKTHTLVRITGAASLIGLDAQCASAAAAALQAAPWVVVRRAEAHPGLIPVGVRGASRSQRFAAWLESRDTLVCVSPLMLVQRCSWRIAPRRDVLPALAVLDTVESIMGAHGLAGAWGPTGSIGFELATGQAAARSESDLDIAVWLAQPLPIAAACSLEAQLARLPVRIDALLETPRGAVALAEFARSPGRCVLRTARGALLVEDCWAQRIEAA